ncbi:putative asparagine synthase [Mycena latifolia]|nr:putative asparagine synthase [Mycena latifolia]
MPCANMNLSFLIPCCFLTLGACTLDDRLHRGSHPTVGVPVFGILQGTRMCGEEKLEECGMYRQDPDYEYLYVSIGQLSITSISSMRFTAALCEFLKAESAFWTQFWQAIRFLLLQRPMCGLISAFYPDSVELPSVADLKKGLEASLENIKHRGPDSRGIYISPDTRVGLGHVRLAIIDLPTGQQPLSDAEELVHCVVTGEIYDHDRIRAEMEGQGYAFKSKSDSELVVQLYKRDGFNLLFNLRGEFAFVLYDIKRRLLFAARDRFGVKPLYYAITNGRILFASEMKAFMGLGWQAEWDIESIVNNGNLGDDRTLFKGVQRLAPGHFAICRASGYLKTQAYWDLSYPSSTAPLSSTLDSMVITVRSLLVDAVRLRLRSDVPVSVYLSGGIDSSAVAGIAAHLLYEKDPNAKLTTFTLVYSASETTDESPIAARTAEYIGAELVKVEATEQELVGALEESIWHSEQVVLSGEGSDEIFGGYPFFLPDYLKDRDPCPASLGLSLPSDAERRQLAAEIRGKPAVPQISHTPMPMDKRCTLLSIDPHITVSWSHLLPNMFKPDILEVVGLPNVLRCVEEGIDARIRHHSVSGNWHSLNVSMYVITKTILDTILSLCGDRADMASSVESRVAFLDHHLVEYVTHLPPSVKIMPLAGDQPRTWHFVEKWILRQAVKPFVTEELYVRKKVPFNPPPSDRPAPTGELLPLQVLLKNRITQANVERLGFIHWPFVRDALSDYLESPQFPSHGAMDERARLLLTVLSYIVLQERFHVPTFKF